MFASSFLHPPHLCTLFVVDPVSTLLVDLVHIFSGSPCVARALVTARSSQAWQCPPAWDWERRGKLFWFSGP